MENPPTGPESGLNVDCDEIDMRTRRGIFTNMMEAYCLLFMWDDTRKCLVNIFEENLNFEETFFQVRWYLVRKRSDKDEKKHQELHLWRIHLDQKEWKFFVEKIGQTVNWIHFWKIERDSNNFTVCESKTIEDWKIQMGHLVYKELWCEMSAWK